MRNKHTLLLAAAGVGCLLVQSAAAQAIINADNPTSTTPDNTSAPSSTAGLLAWDHVGSVGGASGIYVGNGWVLTADHVGAGNFTLDGTTYDWNDQPEIRLNNPSGTPNAAGPADLVMFQLNSVPAGVANLSVAGTSPSPGTAFCNVGYGVARNTAEEYFTYPPSGSGTYVSTTNASAPFQGFGYGSAYTKSWGQNSISTAVEPAESGVASDSAGFVSYDVGSTSGGDNVYAFYSNFSNSTSSDQIINGDSGGGVFNSAGVLIGVNDAINKYNNQPASTVLFGNQSFMIDIAPFYGQITAISGVPEPSSAALLVGAGAGLLLVGRRRRA